jgi:hypothetical protein
MRSTLSHFKIRSIAALIGLAIVVGACTSPAGGAAAPAGAASAAPAAAPASAAPAGPYGGGNGNGGY